MKMLSSEPVTYENCLFLQKCSEAEDLLIDRFLPILNAKKGRIRDLETQLKSAKR